MPTPNATVPVKPNPWAEIEAKCRSDARDFVTDAAILAAERRREAGRYPTESAIREAQVTAVTYLLGTTMAANAELRARVERLESGLWARLTARWRR